MKQKNTVSILCIKNIVLLLVFSITVQALNYYVADPRGPDGIAGNADDVNASDTFSGTLSQPFATITKACSIARAGDTVFIMGGVYNQILRPRFSGKPDSLLVFKNYSTASVEIKNTPGLSDLTQDEIDADQDGRQYGIYLYGLSCIMIQGISVTEVSGWLRAVNSRYIIIQNNSFTKALSTGTTGSIKFLFSNQNKVLNNTIHDGNDNLLLIHSDTNLVAGNNMMKGRHSIWCIRAGNFNVIKNNYFHNEIQKIGEIYDAENDPPLMFDCTKYNLVEGNQFAKTPSSGDASPYAGIQFAGQRCIIRRNLFYETIGPGFDLTLYSDEARYNYENRIYHNVFYKTDFAGVSIAGATNYTFYDNILKNNIFHASVFVANDKRWSWYTGELEGKPVQVLSGRREGFSFVNNAFFNKTAGEAYLITYGDRTSTSNPPQHEVSWWESTYPALFTGSVEKDPSFVNAADHQFQLLNTSPMIDAGTFLTYTKGQGSGTAIPVADVKYFYSGFGIDGETGDEIQLAGQAMNARVTGINYDSNILVLDRSLTWNDSQQVSLQYTGNAPDIGAYEYGMTAIEESPFTQSHLTGSNFLSIQCTPGSNCARVFFKAGTSGEYKLSFYTTAGKLLTILSLGTRSAGMHSVTVAMNSSCLLPGGLYIAKLYSKKSQAQAKLFYLK